MLIKEIMEKTRLSRKAIYYYEEQNLIHPEKNQENQYREYSTEDLQKLILISLLRDLDYTIEEIKGILNSGPNLNKYLDNHIKTLREQACLLQAKAKVLEQVASRFSVDTSLDIQDLLKGVTEFLDSGQNTQDYYSQQLIKNFPGPYGQSLDLFFGPLIEGPFNHEQKYAWYEFLIVLDDLEPDDFPTLFTELYQQIQDQPREELQEKARNFWKACFKSTTGLQQIEKILIQRIKDSKPHKPDHPASREQHMGKIASNIMGQGKDKFRRAMKCFEAISPQYKNYVNSLRALFNKFQTKDTQ